MTNSIDRTAAIRVGWEATTSNPGPLVLANLAWLLVHGAATVERTRSDSTSSIVLYVLGALMMLGAWNIALRFASGEHAGLADFFVSFRVVASYVIAAFVTSFAVVIGLVLLVVPGILLLVRLQMIPFLILDGRANALGAITGSWQLTRGHTVELLVFDIVLVALNFAGAMLFGIGLLLTMPIAVVALAHVYLQLQEPAPDAEEQLD